MCYFSQYHSQLTVQLMDSTQFNKIITKHHTNHFSVFMTSYQSSNGVSVYKLILYTAGNIPFPDLQSLGCFLCCNMHRERQKQTVIFRCAELWAWPFIHAFIGSLLIHPEVRQCSLLPWSEVPLLSSSKQHRKQRRSRPRAIHVQSANPGGVELET